MDEVKARKLVSRLHSLSTPGSDVGSPEGYSDTDFATANDYFPVGIPLETVKVCSWKYTARELEDLELIYEVESSELLVKSSIPGQNNALPATFRVRDISAADLSLVSVVPGSPESMVSRLTLETESLITYTVLSEPRDTSGERDNSCDSREEELNCCAITMTASVHETGHLRDILIFLSKRFKSSGEFFSPGSLFRSPQSQRRDSKPENEGEKERTGTEDEAGSSQVSFISGLPFWVVYIPWWLYSKNVRIFIQRAILLYSFFSVIWAGWQLYRHVNVIHLVLEPFIIMLKFHLSSVMEIFDTLLALFTDWWMKFLSPLNILRAIMLAPVFQLIEPFRAILSPLLTLISPLKSALMGLYTLFSVCGQQLWAVVRVLFRPLSLVWQSVLNSRVAVASLDIGIVRWRWISGLIVGSLRSIGNGLAYFIGYTRVKRKQHIARKLDTSSVSPQHSYTRRTIPIYYSSPLTKQS